MTRSDWSALGRVIEERLERGDQGTAERSCWVTAGFFVEPERYRDDLLGLSEDEESLKWLAIFMAIGRFPHELARRLTAKDIAALVVTMEAEQRFDWMPESAYRSTLDLISMLGDDPAPLLPRRLRRYREW